MIGHSDADVALHALVDAVLGALAEGDIGAHFPERPAMARRPRPAAFMRICRGTCRPRGSRIAHLDRTIVCEMPRIDAQRDAMRASALPTCAGIAIDRVAVKATTSEGLGCTGRGAKASRLTPPPTVRLPLGAARSGTMLGDAIVKAPQ